MQESKFLQKNEIQPNLLIERNTLWNLYMNLPSSGGKRSSVEELTSVFDAHLQLSDYF